jgi:hypothetical protein
MPLHPETFEYLKPTENQMHDMLHAREAASAYAAVLHQLMPEGPDKTYVMRKLREIGMWVNVAITRDADGSPRA